MQLGNAVPRGQSLLPPEGLFCFRASKAYPRSCCLGGRMVTSTRPRAPWDGCSDSSRGDHRVGQNTVPQGDHWSPCSFSELETRKGRCWKSVGWHSDSQVGSRKSDIRWHKDTTLPDTDHRRKSHSIFNSLSMLLTTSRKKLQLGANMSLTLL